MTTAEYWGIGVAVLCGGGLLIGFVIWAICRCVKHPGESVRIVVLPFVIYMGSAALMAWLTWRSAEPPAKDTSVCWVCGAPATHSVWLEVSKDGESYKYREITSTCAVHQHLSAAELYEYRDVRRENWTAGTAMRWFIAIILCIGAFIVPALLSEDFNRTSTINQALWRKAAVFSPIGAWVVVLLLFLFCR